MSFSMMAGLVAMSRISPIIDSLAWLNILLYTCTLYNTENGCLLQNTYGTTGFMHMLKTP